MTGFTAKADITRPANQTAYTALDVIGGALEFKGMGRFANDVVRIMSVDVRANVSAVPAGMTTFRVHLYSLTPPSAIADNAAFNLPSGDRAYYLGYVDTGTVADLGDTLHAQADNLNKLVQLGATGSLFGYLSTAGAFTPAADSEVYQVRIQAIAA